jgi:hypothetical protein
MTAHADLDLREAFELSKLSRLASAAGDIKTMSKAYIHQRDIARASLIRIDAERRALLKASKGL